MPDYGALDKAVDALLAEGLNPGDILREIRDRVLDTGYWTLWGDGQWRGNLVCSICGSGYGGVCGEPGRPADFISLDSRYHKNNPARQMIPWKEWQRRQKEASDATSMGG